MKIIRVFPRRTRATPIDEFAFVGLPPLFVPDADEIHISVTFSWDIPEAERLERAWRKIGRTIVGGPAMGTRGGIFTSGQYVKPGYVITSRGCPNKCWFCAAWKRDGDPTELPITSGWNVLDDNLLACSEEHVRAVFAMLGEQRERVHFTGGFEARIFKPWHAALLAQLKPKQVFFAYDTPDDRRYIRQASEILREAGWGTRNSLRCYCLIGYPRDTFANAESRLRYIMECGMAPMAMLYRDQKAEVSAEWRRFQRSYARPAATYPAARRDRILFDAAVKGGGDGKCTPT